MKNKNSRSDKLIKFSMLTLENDLSGTPILICNSRGKIVRKNKAAYFYDMPRLGTIITSKISCESKQELELLFWGKSHCVFVDVPTAKGIQNATVIFNSSDKSFIWIFPKGLDGNQNNAGSSLITSTLKRVSNRFEGELFNKLQGYFNNQAELIRHKCKVYSSSYTKILDTVDTNISVDDIYYVFTRYLRKMHLCTSAGPLQYQTTITFPEAEIYLVSNPEKFITAALELVSVFAVEGCRSININFSKSNQSTLVMEATINTDVKLKKSTHRLSDVAEQIPTFAIDTVSFDELLRIFNWDFILSPLSDNEIYVKLATRTEKSAAILSAEFTPDIAKRRHAIAYLLFLLSLEDNL